MLELKLEKYARILLYAAPFLALIFIQGFYFPFIITRTIYFRLLLQIGLSLYLLLLALNFKKYRPRINWALGLVLIFFLVQLAAAIFGYDFYSSFWSNFERMEGVISLIYLTIYLFLLQIFLREKMQWLFYIRLILIGSVLVSLYGLAQKFDILPVFEAGVGRVSSTIGNAAFLAGYLLIAAGLGAYYYFNEPEKKYRYFALAAVALDLLVLFFTSTRGAILGLAAGALLILLLNCIFLTGRLKKYSLIILLIAVLAGGTFFIFKEKFAQSNIEFVRRLATISTNDPAINNRLLVWRMALKDYKFHPWLGVGMEHFEVVYNKYYSPDISENWFDRTHNVYLDQLMSGGLLGLSAYLAIFCYLFYLLFKKRREDYWLFAIILSLLAAYGIHNFFVFDTINTSFLYFFLIGLVGFEEKNDQEKNVKINNRAFNCAFISLIFINILVFYQLIYLPVKINRAIYAGYYYILADTFRSYENFKAALSYKLGSTEAAVQLNGMYDVLTEQGSVNAETKKNYYELDREKLAFASKNFPLDIKTKMYLAQLILNNYQDKSELLQAESLLLESVKLSPSRVEPHYLLYNVYEAEGKNAEGRALLEGLVKKLPWYGSAKIMLMDDLIKHKGDPKQIEELFQAGVKQFGYDSFGGTIKVVSYLLGQKRYAEAIPYYLKLINDNPRRYDYRLDLAKVYTLTDNFDAAIEQANIINQQSPDTLKGSEGFVNLLYDKYNKK